MSHDLNERLNQILPKLTSADVLANQGSGGEIGFWIFDYPPEHEIAVRTFLTEVVLPTLARHQPTIRVAAVNLFDLVIGLLEERKLLDKAIAMQHMQGDAKTLESLRRVLKEDKLTQRLVAQHDIAKLDLLILWNVGAVYLREMRKHNFADAIDKWFKLGNNLNQRDTIAVRRTVSGLLKLICPAGDYDKEIVRKCLEYALEVHRRVKEQLKKIGGMEFYDVHFSYLDLEDSQERFVSVPEQSSGALIPDGRLAPGALHTISMGTSEMPGIYRIEIQTIAGGGKVSASGAASREPVRVACDYFKANSSRISASIKPSEHDFHLQLVELQNAGVPQSFTLASFIALCSAALGRPVQSQMAIMGDMSLGGTVVQVRNLAESLQLAFDAGAKKILLPMSSVGDIPGVPGELFAKFQTSFYSDPVDAVFKAIGVE